MLKTILLLLPPAFILLLAIMAVQNNRIPGNLGVRQGRLAPLPASPNAVSSQTDSNDRRVAPLPFKGDLQQTRTSLLQAIGSYPGTKEIIADTPTYIHCVFRTAHLGFKDDVEFHLDAEEKLIHFRSASRVGYSDLGMNRKRYHTLASLYLGKD